MLARIDLPALGTRFALPVYFVQGEQDLLTMPAVTRRYVDSITAPAKGLVLVPLAGHDPNEALVEALHQTLLTLRR
jgi:pimeloyl-ACP methyl ester carboxylesterase